MIYDSIAPYYDLFNLGFDHGEYFEKIRQALSPYTDFPFGSNAALDCGCGTGSLMVHIKNAGFNVTGVDLSSGMLSQAASKPELADCRFILQSLQEIDLFRAYDLIFCCLDTVNHITKPVELQSFFSRLWNFTEPGGFFVFDTKTEQEFRLKTKTFFSFEEGVYLQYKGNYKKPFMTTNLITDDSGYKDKTTVTERFYSNKEIKDMMSKTPFSYVSRFSFHRGERTVFIYRKDIALDGQN